jgi:dihydroflavonol-4-reductase
MKVLVTGATGIVGSNLVRALIADDYHVRTLVRSSSDLRSLEGLPVETCIGDVLDPTSLRVAARGCSLVFHAAASFSYWGQSPDEQMDVAVRGTSNVLSEASKARVQRVVLTSSSVVLGSTATPQVMDESITLGERESSSYAQSKVAQERTAFETGARLGLDVIAVCPTLAMGAFDFRLSASNANIANYLNDPFRSTFLGGCNIVAASDVAAGQIIAAERGVAGCRYVLGSENLTWKAVHALTSELTGTFGPSLVLNHTSSYLAAAAMEAAAQLTGARPLATRDEAKMSARFYWYSHERISDLGYTPVAARAAIAEAVAWLILRSRINDSVVHGLVLAPEVTAASARLTAIGESRREAKTRHGRHAASRAGSPRSVRTDV